ncbi:unnamed protein product, partial [Owenia fusiformis]
KYNHWFDGLALLHRFDFDNGVVKYHSKFLRSDSYVQALEQNRIVISEFGTAATPDPCKTVFQRFVSHFKPSPEEIASDNNIVSITRIGDGVYAANDTVILRRIDHNSLDTIERVDMSKLITIHTSTAHPHTMPDGTYYNIGINFKAGCYHVIEIAPDSKKDDPVEGAKILHTIPMESRMHPAYFHSFNMSANYIIFHEQPLRFSMFKVMTWKLFKSGVDALMSFHKNLKSNFHVCDKRTGEVLPLKFVSEPFVHFHVINSYEESGHLIIDLCGAGDSSGFDTLYLAYLKGIKVDDEESYKNSKLSKAQRSWPIRFVIPLDVTKESPKNTNLITLAGTTATAMLKKDGSVYLTCESLIPEDLRSKTCGMDFPQINYNFYNGKPYRYCYFTGFPEFVIPPDKLIKLDVKTKTTQIWQEDECYPSEPMFVPAPDATREDEGVVLSVVISPNKDKPTFVLVLDGESFKEVGRASIPCDIPLGVHGTFI